MSEHQELIRRAQTGDLDAYAALVEDFRELALTHARRLLGDHQLAEDATQEAFLQAYLDLATLREPMAFASWLRRIVHKHCDRILRRRRVRMVALDENDVADRGTPESDLERREQSSRLHQALGRLGSGEGELLTLCYIRGLSHRQIASHLQLPETTVNIRLHAARQHLKKELEAMATQEDLAVLGPIHDRLATSLAPVFSDATELSVQISVAEPRETTYGDFIGGLGRHSCTYYFIAAPTDAWVTLDFNVPLALALCNRCHSAEELAQEAELRSGNPPDGAWLLNYQLGTLTTVIRRVLRGFEVAWKPAADLTVRDCQIELTPRLLLQDPRLTQSKEAVAAISHTVGAGDFADLSMNLCYPSAALVALAN